MFEIFALAQRSPEEVAFAIAFLAILVVAVGYASDAITRSQGYGPGGNGIILVFGAIIGISLTFLYIRYFNGVLASNAYQVQMFSLQLPKTATAAGAGALMFFLFMVYVKRITSN